MESKESGWSDGLRYAPPILLLLTLFHHGLETLLHFFW